ncbi:MAG: dipeptide epimerase [Caulobacteraceae bacterium]|nr:dipeptide epimerase [Caulobacteraceae bacterium]
MDREFDVRRERFALNAPFRISRGVKTAAEVIVVQVAEGGQAGFGEAVPYARYGESLDSVEAELAAVADAVRAGATREEAQAALSPGAARNALDCALWDLAARRAGTEVSTLLGRDRLPVLETAVTVSLDAPAAMAAAARALAGAPLLKVKVAAEGVEARVAAVREAAAGARLIVDPNESWNLDLLAYLQPALQALGVELVEQPLPAGKDAGLQGLAPLVPICADESCHVAADLPRLAGLYQAVNIKLDKAGGLTAALDLYAAARAQGFRVMVGCMICSSLGIAPALHLARDADWVDLDGPIWLQADRPGGVRIENGRLFPPAAGFWGSPPPTR